MIILRHYLKRMLTEPITLMIFILLPVALVAINIYINLFNMDGVGSIVNGRDMMAGSMSITMMIMFQFMGGTILIDFFYNDFRSDKRWRLMAAPKAFSRFVFSNAIGSVIFNLISGSFILAVGFIFFNAYYPNLIVILVLMFVLAVLSALLAMLVSLFVPKKGTAEGVIMIFTWAMAIPGGMFGDLNLPSVLDTFFTRITPFAQAIRVMLYTGFGRDADMSMVMQNLGFLAGLSAVVAVVIAIVSRRRAI